MRPILFLGMYPWDYHELSDTVRSMAKASRNTGSMTPIFINPTSEMKKLQLKVTTTMDLGVHVITPGFGFLPTRYGFYRLRDRLAAGRTADYLKKTADVADAALYVTSATLELAEHYVDHLKPREIIFDVVDDNLGFPMDEHRRLLLTKLFQKIAAKATLVTAVSEELVTKTEQLCHRSVVYLPNGVDFDHFSQPKPVPADLVQSEKSRICFVGAFTSWIDLRLLSKTAEAFEGAELLLIGPKFSSSVREEQFDALLNLPNVNWIGARPFDAVPGYLQASDVLILPRTKEAYSQACDPLKLYEYLATGKPVVTTELPSAERFADVASIATNDEEFIAAIARSLSEPHDPAPQLLRVCSRSWENRVGMIQELLSGKTVEGKFA